MGNDSVAMSWRGADHIELHSVFRMFITHTEKYRNHIDMGLLYVKRRSFSIFVSLIWLAAVWLELDFEKVGYDLISTVK